ncbi:adenine deaminase [Iodidimonas gelatinilytica]|uniref:Adenine deaminase n=1 Tax=Iodidimonas gelatinilytica TaxID=1236966 RepID=A0A5A7MX21_9PROT|nr:adenosine deaminase [Iodidimonas gelatinilytica]GEQ98401.1 adenine deaminase [Iodidimonas gelatinilytica]GER00408.1 adenine deaminase [Iodidimonas gelatinilytica]
MSADPQMRSEFTPENARKRPKSSVPMAELHCHLEGTVSPVMAMRIGARHGLDLGDVIDGDGHYRWANFAEFLDIYDRMAAAICTPEDYYDITYDYYSKVAQSGVIYGESFVSPDHAIQHGISYQTLIDSVSRAMQQAERDFGIVCRIILIAVRHYGVEKAEKLADLAHKHPHPFVTGFGMGGDEQFLWPHDFAKAYAMASDAGLGLTAHAGEVCGPESIRDTLESLKVSRIGHGVRAIEDDALMAELRDREIILEVCPGSNIALGVHPDLAAHPLRALVDNGLRVTLSSDDPPFFHTHMQQEYEQAQSVHGFKDADLLRFTRTAIEGAFCDADTKEKLLSRLNA